jgi:hypothetical protein
VGCTATPNSSHPAGQHTQAHSSKHKTAGVHAACQQPAGTTQCAHATTKPSPAGNACLNHHTCQQGPLYMTSHKAHHCLCPHLHTPSIHTQTAAHQPQPAGTHVDTAAQSAPAISPWQRGLPKLPPADTDSHHDPNNRVCTLNGAQHWRPLCNQHVQGTTTKSPHQPRQLGVSPPKGLNTGTEVETGKGGPLLCARGSSTAGHRLHCKRGLTTAKQA